MYACIDIPRCSCTGTGLIDDPLEKLEFGVAHVVKRTDLGTEGQKHGRPLGPRKHPRFLSVAPVRLERTVGLFDVHRKRSIETGDDLRLEPEPEPEAESCLLRSSALTSLHKHLEWTRRVFLSSRHFSHWDTGRPLRLISKSGRSVWLQDEVRCPLMQDSLVRIVLS